MVLDLIHVEVFHYQMVVGLVKNIICGADMSSLVYIDNKTKDILFLGKGTPDCLDDTTLTAEENILKILLRNRSLH